MLYREIIMDCLLRGTSWIFNSNWSYIINNRYMGAVNNTTSVSNDIYRGWKYNYMFRPNSAIIRFTSKGYQRFVTTMGLCKDGEISSSGYNYVIIKNLVREGGGSVTLVCADMGCGASAGVIAYAAVLCGVSG